MKDFRCIAVATDFSAPSSRAVDVAIDLANRFESKLVLVHCFEVPSYVYAGMLQSPVDLLGPIEAAAKSQLDEALAAARTKHPNTSSELRSGLAADEILSAARAHHADLVVVGTHGRRGVAHLVLGSVAEKVVRTSTVPVVAVPIAKENP